MIKAFHGLCAFRGARNHVDMVNAAGRCVGVQVAAADRPIGPMGVVVWGSCPVAYDQDAWTEVDDNGQRRGTSVMTYEIANPTHEEWVSFAQTTMNDWEAMASDDFVYQGYCEAVVDVEGLCGVWIRPDRATARHWRVAEFLARRMKRRVIALTKTSRIWDVGHEFPISYSTR